MRPERGFPSDSLFWSLTRKIRFTEARAGGTFSAAIVVHDLKGSDQYPPASFATSFGGNASSSLVAGRSKTFNDRATPLCQDHRGFVTFLSADKRSGVVRETEQACWWLHQLHQPSAAFAVYACDFIGFDAVFCRRVFRFTPDRPEDAGSTGRSLEILNCNVRQKAPRQ